MQRNITVLLTFVLAMSLGIVARAGDGDQKNRDRMTGDSARFGRLAHRQQYHERRRKPLHGNTCPTAT